MSQTPTMRRYTIDAIHQHFSMPDAEILRMEAYRQIISALDLMDVVDDRPRQFDLLVDRAHMIAKTLWPASEVAAQAEFETLPRPSRWWSGTTGRGVAVVAFGEAV